ncbi:hypothetical protein BGX33_004866 [Mortierella sp. NVP41]|nr:hypothetical protein BGX33_004866 [Mortierella sp. NVP41]
MLLGRFSVAEVPKVVSLAFDLAARRSSTSPLDYTAQIRQISLKELVSLSHTLWDRPNLLSEALASSGLRAISVCSAVRSIGPTPRLSSGDSSSGGDLGTSQSYSRTATDFDIPVSDITRYTDAVHHLGQLEHVRFIMDLTLD